MPHAPAISSEQLGAALHGSYVLEHELTASGMSSVFVAHEIALGHTVVIKVVPAKQAEGVSIERFKHEIQLLARLQHPNIIPILTAGSAARHLLATLAPTMARRARALSVLLMAAVFAAACKVKLLDDYNKEAQEGLLRIYGKVESLYDALHEADAPGLRVYSPFAERYAEIHEMIRVQVLREGARPLNKESFGIISTIDTIFTRYREQHRRDNDYNEALIPRHRDNLRRMFTAALKAEQVKQEPPDQE